MHELHPSIRANGGRRAPAAHRRRARLGRALAMAWQADHRVLLSPAACNWRPRSCLQPRSSSSMWSWTTFWPVSVRTIRWAARSFRSLCLRWPSPAATVASATGAVDAPACRAGQPQEMARHPRRLYCRWAAGVRARVVLRPAAARPDQRGRAAVHHDPGGAQPGGWTGEPHRAGRDVCSRYGYRCC